MEPLAEIDRDDLRTGVPGARSRKELLIRSFLWYNVSLLFQRRVESLSVIEDWRVELRAFVFPGQGGGVSEPAPEMVSEIQRVVGERIPDQVKIFVRAARDADESRTMKVRPDVVAGHSLGEYGAAYAAGCFDFEMGLWLVAQRDRFLAEAARECPGGTVAILRTDPAEVEKALGGPGGPVVANYNSPRQTVVSGLRDALGEAVSRIKGRKIPLNVSFAAHSPYVAAAGEKMRGVLDSVEFRKPEVPIVSAIDGSVLTSAG